MAETPQNNNAGVVIDLDPLVEAIEGNAKKLIKEVALRLFANSNFDLDQTKSVKQIAEECVSRAIIFVAELDKGLKACTNKDD